MTDLEDGVVILKQKQSLEEVQTGWKYSKWTDSI